MLVESLSYLRTADDAVRTVAIGAVLTLLSVLVVPGLLVAGYLVRVLRRTAGGDDEPPAFDDWESLLVEGALAWVVTVAYAVVPAAVAAALVAGGVVTVAGAGSALGGVARGLAALAGALLAVAVALAAAYALPAALANLATRRRLAAGFDVGAIRPALTDPRYAVGWLTAAVVLVGASAVAGLFAPVPVLGQVVGAVVGFYAAVAAAYVVGHTWATVAPRIEVVRGEAVAEGAE